MGWALEGVFQSRNSCPLGNFLRVCLSLLPLHLFSCTTFLELKFFNLSVPKLILSSLCLLSLIFFNLCAFVLLSGTLLQLYLSRPLVHSFISASMLLILKRSSLLARCSFLWHMVLALWVHYILLFFPENIFFPSSFHINCVSPSS